MDMSSFAASLMDIRAKASDPMNIASVRMLDSMSIEGSAKAITACSAVITDVQKVIVKPAEGKDLTEDEKALNALQIGVATSAKKLADRAATE